MDNNPLRPDEEYHFSETEGSDVFGKPPTSPASLANKMKRRNVIITIVVIIGLLALYKLYGVFVTPSVKPVPVAPKTAMPPPPPVATIPAPMPPPTPALSQGTTSRIEKLESSLSQVSASLSDMQTKLDGLNKSLQTFSNELTQQQAAITALQQLTQPKPQVVVAKKIPVIKRKPYYVQAMVPGRAWLRTANGVTSTVKVGDNLPGYGLILTIDPNQGTVTTSSGITISYGPGEN